MGEQKAAFWSVPPEELIRRLGTAPAGLAAREAARRLEQYGPGSLKAAPRPSPVKLLLGQFRSPIIIVLILAACLSVALGDRIDSVLILLIVFVSGLLGFWQEKGAQDAVGKLLSLVQVKSTVLRDGREQEVPMDRAVPGDIVVLYAGEGVPGDCLLLESHNLFVNESALTGEAFPVEKETGPVPADTPLARRRNAVFMGTHIVSGTGRALVVHTGRATEFGRISGRLERERPATEFERGIRRFGYFLMLLTGGFAVGIAVCNILFHRPPLQSVLFALSLAVGFSPQLLPAVISINLARGAKRMSEKKVIVKRLGAIEDFGAMNILCADKTGTLTEGTIRIQEAVDPEGRNKDKILFYAWLNARFAAGYANPIDGAIRAYDQFDPAGYRRLDEIPYDFSRRRVSVAVEKENEILLITKGAVPEILDICSSAELSDGSVVDIAGVCPRIRREYEDLGRAGFRMIAVAYKALPQRANLQVADEARMVFLGYLVIVDPLKEDVLRSIGRLKGLGVALKVLTGDNELIAAHVTRQLALTDAAVLTGRDLETMSDADLREKVKTVDVFAEVAPVHKERIIAAFRQAGNVVGYIGDGINDTLAFHAADVSISVNSAVDVTKEAAAIILLEKDLDVLADGVREGRRTFANTLKYVFIATSANFGNMFSMTGGSLILPFLPALPSQILLTNLLTDLPALTMAGDRVDPEQIQGPRRWHLRFIARFMMTFGILSSFFDYLTFGILWYFMRADAVLFRSGWFIESVALSALVVLVIRTRRLFFRSLPGRLLLWATVLDVGFVILLPYTAVGHVFALYPLPPRFLGYLAVLLVLFFLVTEVVKRLFYRHLARIRLPL
jgi:Mg2+-importing ATPase